MEYTKTRAPGRELSIPFAANRLARFSVPCCTYLSGRGQDQRLTGMREMNNQSEGGRKEQQAVRESRGDRNT